MKKLVLTLFTVLSILFLSSVQSFANTASTEPLKVETFQNEGQLNLAKAGMATLVASTSSVYKEGMSNEDFMGTIVSGRKASPELQAVLEDVFNYHAKGYSICQIAETEDGSSLYKLAKSTDGRIESGSDKDLDALFGGNNVDVTGGDVQARICWKCILRMIRDLLNSMPLD